MKISVTYLSFHSTNNNPNALEPLLLNIHVGSLQLTWCALSHIIHIYTSTPAMCHVQSNNQCKILKASPWNCSVNGFNEIIIIPEHIFVRFHITEMDRNGMEWKRQMKWSEVKRVAEYRVEEWCVAKGKYEEDAFGEVDSKYREISEAVCITLWVAQMLKSWHSIKTD